MDTEEPILDELTTVKDLTTLTVLNNMINEGDNVPLKTDIKNPKYLTVLKTISHVLKLAEYDLASSYIEFFIDTLLVYRISENRQSRIEIRDVLMAQISLERDKRKNELDTQFK